MAKEVAEIILQIADLLKPYKLSQEDTDKLITHFVRIMEIVLGIENAFLGKE